jgi:hypothetical protein
MAQHGYLREYDEGFDRGDDRDRRRDDDRERGWRGSDRDERDPDREFMFGGRDRGNMDRGDDDRGFFSRVGDQTRSWLRDDDREARGSRRADWERSPRNFGSHQDDHYRSWRDKQMQALDRDYADYCREREQQFHSDFDAWRSRRRANEQPLRTGMTQTAEEVMELEDPVAESTPSSVTSPMGAATLGTNTEGTGSRRRG